MGRGDGPRAISLPGASFRVADDKPTFWDRVVSGRWEPATLAVLDRLTGPGTTLLDIGAWVGPVSLYAAARGARVIAVEPDPAALDGLRANLAANPLIAARVTVVARALALCHGSVRMGARRKPGDSMSSTLLTGSSSSWAAETLTPADLLAMAGDEGRLVVKLDIEGGEYAVLPDLVPRIDRPGTALIVSLHPSILVETGDADAHGRAEAAFAGLGGWTSLALAGGAAEPCRPDRDGFARHDTWLLMR